MNKEFEEKVVSQIRSTGEIDLVVADVIVHTAKEAADEAKS